MRSTHWLRKMRDGRGRIGGLLLLLLGFIILLVNLGILRSVLIQTWWPVLFIALGLARLLRHRGWHRRRRPYTDFGQA
jgi:hypothetical protein